MLGSRVWIQTRQNLLNWENTLTYFVNYWKSFITVIGTNKPIKGSKPGRQNLHTRENMLAGLMVELVTNSPRIRGSLGCTQENKSLIRLAITKMKLISLCVHETSWLRRKKQLFRRKFWKTFCVRIFTNVHINRMFIPGKSFKPAWVKHLSGALHCGRLLALPTNIRLGRKAFHGENTLAYCEH